MANKKYKGLTTDEAYVQIFADLKNKLEDKAKKLQKEKLTPEEKLNQKYLKKFKRSLHVQPFSIETIRKAYEATGLTPSQGIYYINSFGTIVNRAYIDDTKELACPMGALCISRDASYLHLDGDLWKEANVAQVLDVPAPFVSGFIQGFDNCNPPHARCSPWLIQGYENGKTILNLLVAAGEIEAVSDAPPASFPTKEAEQDLIKHIQKELNKKESPEEGPEDLEEVPEDYEAEIEPEEIHYVAKKSVEPKKEILIDLNKSLKEAMTEMLDNFNDTNLMYLIPTRYGNKRLTASVLKQEIDDNTDLGQQYVLDLLYLAKDILVKETERLPFRFGYGEKPLPPRKSENSSVETFLQDEEDES